MKHQVVIKGSKLIETSRAITIPTFLRSKNGAVYIAFIRPDRVKEVVIYDFSKEIKDTTHFPDLEEGKYTEITAEEFYTAYNECRRHIEADFAFSNEHDNHSTNGV